MARGKRKGEILSSLGIVFEIIKKLSDAIRNLGGADDDLRLLLTNSKLVKQIAELIMSGKQKTYKVVVDYGKSLTEMISLGKYDRLDSLIKDKYFPILGVGTQEVELVMVHLNKDATTKEVLKHLYNNGLEAAEIEHLLAFGAAYPDVQREFPIVVLGSGWVDDSAFNYPCLDFHDGVRRVWLTLSVDDGRWNDDCGFLALRK